MALGPEGHTALSSWDFSLLLHIPVDWYFPDALITPYPKNTDRYSCKMLLKYLVRSTVLVYRLCFVESFRQHRLKPAWGKCWICSGRDGSCSFSWAPSSLQAQLPSPVPHQPLSLCFCWAEIGVSLSLGWCMWTQQSVISSTRGAGSDLAYGLCVHPWEGGRAAEASSSVAPLEVETC